MGSVHSILQLKEAIGGQVGCGDADVLGDYTGQRADKVLSHSPGGRFVGYGEDTSVVCHEADLESGEGLATTPITCSNIQIILANRKTDKQTKSARGITSQVVGASSRSHIMQTKAASVSAPKNQVV